MTQRPWHVMFLCTGNSARSILAESILRRDGGARFAAFSAGSRPAGAVNPFALAVLEEAGYPMQGLRSKGWDELSATDAPAMDLVITVCDAAAGEACPIWPGRPLTAHWGLADPAAVEGTDAEKSAAFHRTLQNLRRRIGRLIELPIDELDAGNLAAELRAIGREPGATARAFGADSGESDAPTRESTVESTARERR